MPSANRNRPARQRRPATGNESAPVAVPPPPVPVYTTHEPTPAQDHERIGDILRRRRQQRGDDLQQIADYLCIRKSFLVALENNAYDELPADAYVVGFLRSYAAYLGFDGGDAINRYRSEMSGRRRKPALVLPTPIAEGRTPSALIMIAAAAAALLIYVAWYSLSATSRTALSAEPALLPVPASIAAAPAAPANTTQPVHVPAPIPGGIALSSPPPNETGSTGAAPDQSALAPVNAASHAKPQELAIPSALPQETAQSSPPPANSRLVVRAEKESWVVIADAKGNTVLDRVMKPGDTFPVPDQPGLKLTTGNSGGIILVLDGKDLPKLSRNSSILHDISLDPDKLGNAPKPVKQAKPKPDADE